MSALPQQHSDLLEIVNNVFLPPRLPSGARECRKWEGTLLDLLITSLERFRKGQDGPSVDLVNQAEIALRGFKESRTSFGKLDASSLVNLLGHHAKHRGLLPLHVEAQNAGIIIRSTDSAVVLSVFELSPMNKAIYSTSGRLRRHFPEHSTTVPLSAFEDSEFVKSIAEVLDTMSSQKVKEMQPQVRKAGKEMVEERDTAHPFIVTKLFTAILQACGGKPAETNGIWKHTREEVLWSDAALPWRRSPVWLLLRVVLNLALSNPTLVKQPVDSTLYKQFMSFFMAGVIETGISYLSSETLYVMTAKLSRRLLKLSASPTGAWLSEVQRIMEKTTLHLEKRWTSACENDAQQLEIPTLDMNQASQDTLVKLPKLATYIRSITQRKPLAMQQYTPRTPDLLSFCPDELPNKAPALLRDDCTDACNLASFEDWVRDGLDAWLLRYVSESGTCAALRKLIEGYHTAAMSLYSDIPEGMSIMFLTIIELWIACDKAAVEQCPLIGEYSPEIPTDTWSSLMLKEATDMKRLTVAEVYLSQRHKVASKRRSILADFGCENDFGTRYFRTSQQLQDLRAQIEKKAMEDREAKKREFTRLKDEYNDHMSKHRDLDCEYFYTHNRFGDLEQIHSGSCEKCQHKEDAHDLRINIHEWPLPSQDSQASATVFELQVPPFFGHWRDCTLFLLHDVLAFKPMGNKPIYCCEVADFRGLWSFHRPFTTCLVAISLLSQAKPQYVTHRKALEIAVASQSDVCLNTGPVWQLYDRKNAAFLSNPKPTIHISKNCTIQLAHESKSLQEFMNRPWTRPGGVTPNTVIASQRASPDHLTVDEYKSTCSISLGPRIVWGNLLMQLAMPSVDLNKIETLAFVWQAIEQAGQAGSDWRRQTHQQLEDEAFVQACLGELCTSLTRARESWELRNTVALLTLVGCRLLAVGCMGSATTRSCLNLLSDCRAVSYQWQGVLRAKALTSSDQSQRIDFARRSHEAALVCLLSFDMRDEHLQKLLQQPNEAKVYLECLMTLRDTEFCMVKTPHLQALRLRSRRLIHCCRTWLSDEIANGNNKGLDLAIASTWNSFRRDQESCWNRVAMCWLETQVSGGTPESSTLTVHFNALTGELLVNGLPRGRLPQDYEAHLDYRMLFGYAAIECMPTIESGMHFAAGKFYKSYEVWFAMDNGDLAVRIRKDGKTWELVPNHTFQDILPATFVKEMVFWYDVADSKVLLCPKHTPWELKNASWTVQKAGSTWSMTQAGGEAKLIFPSTRTGKEYALIFEPLETIFGLHISFKEQPPSLHVHIPRFPLDFHVDARSAQILSRQYKGMMIDSNQGLGTLIGLKSKLVLVQAETAHFRERMVLIPEGCTACSMVPDSDTVQVTIRRNPSAVQAFHLDEHLGQIKGNGSLASLLFLAELHALTSSCLEDQFTGQTGTEQALAILESATLRSLSFSNQQEVDYLHRLRCLSPTRRFYPKNLQDMSDVSWKSIPPTRAQSDMFLLVTEKLYAEAQKFKFLRATPLPKLEPLDSNIELNKRALRRSYIRHGTRKHRIPAEPDEIYDGSCRRSVRLDQRHELAVRFGAALFRGETLVDDTSPPADPTSWFYQRMLWSAQVRGSSETSSGEETQYGACLLDKPGPILQSKLCSWHRWLSQPVHRQEKTKLIAWIATLAFAEFADVSCLRMLLALASVSTLTADTLKIPSEYLYDLTRGYEYKKGPISKHIYATAQGFDTSTESRLERLHNESGREADSRRRKEYRTKLDEGATRLEKALRDQWPCAAPRYNDIDMSYFHATTLEAGILGKFNDWHKNLMFKQYLDRVCMIVGSAPTAKIPVDCLLLVRSPYCVEPTTRSVDLTDVLRMLAAPQPEKARKGTSSDAILAAFLQSESSDTSTTTSESGPKPFSTPDHCSSVQLLSRSLSAKASTSQEHRYVAMLDESIDCLSAKSFDMTTSIFEGGAANEFVNEWARSITESHRQALSGLTQVLKLEVPSSKSGDCEVSPTWRIVSQTHHWPRITCRNLLSLIGFQSRSHISLEWRKTILGLGETVVDLQTAARLFKCYKNPRELLKELENARPRSWEPIEYPDSLLLEIEGKLRIRQVQSDIASDMIGPPGEQNAVMQLNMGEGKSSVIAPMVASHLADGRKLVRIIVAKPQAPQMRDSLLSTLGGLMDRQLYQMPLSRSNRLSSSQVETLSAMCRQCRQEGGVMLVQPEHILSCQLMTVEMPIRHDSTVAKKLFDLHGLFEAHARDIVDESDENFSCKLENIYTMGDQRGIEHAPGRWILIQEVLGLVFKMGRHAKMRFPKGIELDDVGRPSVPMLRFLHPEATNEVLCAVAKVICKNGMRGFPIAFQSQEMRSKLREYILERDPSPSTITSVEASNFWRTHDSNLLLLRGLFASGILAFVFGQKRWRVNYGLDAERKPSTRLVVPYRAKDNPSLRSEFSQPEVVICLTCLAYYYGGLSDADLTLALEHLCRSDQADVEYERWVATSDGLSDGFRQIESINLQDKDQCRAQVFPHFKHSKGAVDYFLCHIVFTKEMKEFPHKLSASGWDLGRNKQHALTGFSGTNDSQHVLPVQVKQLERSEQKHTNALVLSHLLQLQNSSLRMTEANVVGACRSHDLLQLVTEMETETRVILDVGAMVLDLHNEEVAREWLKVVSHRADIQAAIFCNASDEKCVVDRRGYVERLSTSPFAAQLERCLVFLDEAHTRGIDLQLPAGYRAAVTLGANLTKDRLIQACMRMRKLAEGHSVVFLIPEEIETKICETTGKVADQPLTVADVLQWSIHETWADLRRSMPLWMNQGATFAKQMPRWNAARNDGNMSEAIAETFLESEAQTLKERYQPHRDSKSFLSTEGADPEILDQIQERCREYDGLNLDFSALQEEQERELAPEIEQERNVERPESATPMAHHLHPRLTKFVKTGALNLSEVSNGVSSCFEWAFQCFRTTAAHGLLAVDTLPKGLIVTRDFAMTVERAGALGAWTDCFQRSVQWVLTDRLEDDSMSTMVVISPYEANELMNEIKLSKHVVLHFYAPRHNKAYKSLDSLSLYTVPACPTQSVPARLEAELALFSGQLYFESFEHYVRACDFLCLAHTAASDDMQVGADGFIDPASHSNQRDGSTIFKSSPVKFFKLVMTRIRRQCEGIDKTHVGKMLEGALLTEEDFEEA